MTVETKVIDRTVRNKIFHYIANAAFVFIADHLLFMKVLMKKMNSLYQFRRFHKAIYQEDLNQLLNLFNFPFPTTLSLSHWILANLQFAPENSINYYKYSFNFFF